MPVTREAMCQHCGEMPSQPGLDGLCPACHCRAQDAREEDLRK